MSIFASSNPLPKQPYKAHFPTRVKLIMHTQNVEI